MLDFLAAVQAKQDTFKHGKEGYPSRLHAYGSCKNYGTCIISSKVIPVQRCAFDILPWGIMGNGPSQIDGPAALTPIQFSFDGLPRTKDNFGTLMSRSSQTVPQVPGGEALYRRCAFMSRLLSDVQNDILLSLGDWSSFFGDRKKHTLWDSVVGQLFALFTGVLCLPEDPAEGPGGPGWSSSEWCCLMEAKYKAQELALQRGSKCVEVLGELSVSLCGIAQLERALPDKLKDATGSLHSFLNEQPEKLADVLISDLKEDGPFYDGIRMAMKRRVDVVVAATLLHESGWAFVSQKVNGVCRAPSLVRPVGFPDPTTTTKAGPEEQRKLESIIEQGPDLFWEVHGTPSHDDMGTWVTHNGARYWCKVELPVSVYYVGVTK